MENYTPGDELTDAVRAHVLDAALSRAEFHYRIFRGDLDDQGEGDRDALRRDWLICPRSDDVGERARTILQAANSVERRHRCGALHPRLYELAWWVNKRCGDGQNGR